MWLQRILSVLLAVNVFAGLVCLALLFAMDPASRPMTGARNFPNRKSRLTAPACNCQVLFWCQQAKIRCLAWCSCTGQDRILKHRFAHMLKLSPSWVSPP